MSLFGVAKRWKVFCARCGHSRKFNGDDAQMRHEIDKPCPFCGLYGSDSVEQ